MSRDAIISQLTANYKVEKLQGEGDDWFVAEKRSPDTWIGTLGFHEGKLTYASRSWTQGQEDNYEFAQALWGAMAQMSDEDQRICSFEVPTSRSPTAEMSYVRFSCGQKRIDITTTNRMLVLAKKEKKIQDVPWIEFQKEPPPRKVFLEMNHFEELLAQFPTTLKPLITFLYFCGVRVGGVAN